VRLEALRVEIAATDWLLQCGSGGRLSHSRGCCAITRNALTDTGPLHDARRSALSACGLAEIAGVFLRSGVVALCASAAVAGAGLLCLVVFAGLLAMGRGRFRRSGVWLLLAASISRHSRLCGCGLWRSSGRNLGRLLGAGLCVLWCRINLSGTPRLGE